MAEFASSFSGMAPDRKLTLRELTRGLRMMLAAEQEAVHLYESLADATDNKLAKAVLQDIADEERVHAGEFQRVLNILLEDEERLLAEGASEVDELAEELGGGGASESPDKGIPTVGDLKSEG